MQDYFEMCRKITAAAIREFADWVQADGKHDEATTNAAMATMVIFLENHNTP